MIIICLHNYMVLHILIPPHWPSWYSVRQWSRRPGFNLRSRHIKDFKKWYLIPTCLTLSNIRYVSRVKWSNPGKGVASSLTP